MNSKLNLSCATRATGKRVGYGEKFLPFWGISCDVEFAGLRVGFGGQKAISQVAQCRTIVLAAHAITKHAFFGAF